MYRCACREETVQLHLSGQFVDLIGYLEELRNIPVLYLDIVALDVKKPTKSGGKCDILLKLKLFLSI